MPEIISIGEPLIQLNAVNTGPLRYNQYFEKHIAGAELNFCVGARRSGFSSGMIGRVGDDEFGINILQYLSAEGVDSTQIKTVEGLPTGVYFIQRGYPIPGRSIMYYYRKGSAGSTLCPEDVRENYLSDVKLVHLTGITPALSETAKQAWLKILDLAKRRKIKVSLDTNIRSKFLKEGDARDLLKPAAEKSYILLTDPNDMKILYGSNDVDEKAKQLLKKDVQIVVMKLGSKGAIVYSRDGVFTHKQFQVPVVDPVGAGDAFAAIFVSRMLKGFGVKRALEAATVAGSLVVTRRGDNENIPSQEDIETFLSSMKGE